MLRRAQGLARLAMVLAAAGAVAVGAYVFYLVSRPAVTVTRVVEGPVVQAFYATGTVAPRREYPISTSFAGIVKTVNVDKGNAVRKGDVLAVIEDPAMEHAAEKARVERELRREFADEARSPVIQEFDAKIKAAEQMLDVARKDEERFHALAERNAASWRDRDQSFEHMQTLVSQVESLRSQRASRLWELRADLEVAESAYNEARASLALGTLRSPIDGVVLDWPVSLGVRLELNGHVMQIADVSIPKLVMRAQVDEENVRDAAVGGVVRMTLYSFPGQTFAGTVSDIYPKADPSRRTFEVDVKFADPDARLKAGMTGELAFVIQQKERALIVPAQAVQGGAVYVVKDGRVKKSAATVGIRSTERAEIVSGLSASDTVLVSPVGDLADNQAVRIGTTLDPVVAADLNKPKESTFKGFR